MVLVTNFAQDLFRHSLQCSHDRRIRRDDSARASQDALEILMSNDAWSASTATNEPPSDPPTTPPDLDCDYTVRGLYRRSPRGEYYNQTRSIPAYSTTLTEDMSYVDVDVKCVSFPGDIGGPLCIPCLVPFVSPPAHVTTVTFGKDGRPLVKPLYIYASDESTCVQHNIGEFTVKTARGQLEVGRTHWGGPVLVLKYENVAMNSFMDIDDTDLADVSAFFTLS